ncbi:MAG: hypothetical protein MZU97_11955 [Bacillus subtilis]|nr:hypothetical protein [Bacillus subtilis]
MLEGIAWAGDAWTPPRLQEGSYQVPGKVAEDLHPVEAALLLELPLASVAAIMLEGLETPGPRRGPGPTIPSGSASCSARKAESEYEELFLAAFDAEGHVLSGLLADFFEDAIKRLQEKIWDCDLEATRAFYRRAPGPGRPGGDREPRAAPRRPACLRPATGTGTGWSIPDPPTTGPCACPRTWATGYADFMRSAVLLLRLLHARPTWAPCPPATRPATTPATTPAIRPATAPAIPPATRPATPPACPGAATDAVRGGAGRRPRDSSGGSPTSGGRSGPASCCAPRTTSSSCRPTGSTSSTPRPRRWSSSWRPGAASATSRPRRRGGPGRSDAFFRSLEARPLGAQARTLDRVAYDFRLHPPAGPRRSWRSPTAATTAAASATRAAPRQRDAAAPTQGRRAGRSEVADLPARDLEKILRIFKEEAKVPFFSFTGGEPLLAARTFAGLVPYAVRIGLRTNLVTNGTLATPARAAGPLPARDPDRPGQPGGPGRGAPRRPVRSGRGLGAERRGHPGLDGGGHLGADQHRPRSRTAWRPCDRTARPCRKSLGVERMSMNLFIPYGPESPRRTLFVPYSGDRRRRGRGPEARPRRRGVDFLWYSPTPMCLYNPLARGLGNKNCAACDGLLSVNPRGDVLPCSSWDEGVGNLLPMGFRKVWFGERAASLKNKELRPRGVPDLPGLRGLPGGLSPVLVLRGVRGDSGGGTRPSAPRHAGPASSAEPHFRPGNRPEEETMSDLSLKPTVTGGVPVLPDGPGGPPRPGRGPLRPGGGPPGGPGSPAGHPGDPFRVDPLRAPQGHQQAQGPGPGEVEARDRRGGGPPPGRLSPGPASSAGPPGAGPPSRILAGVLLMVVRTRILRGVRGRRPGGPGRPALPLSGPLLREGESFHPRPHRPEAPGFRGHPVRAPARGLRPDPVHPLRPGRGGPGRARGPALPAGAPEEVRGPGGCAVPDGHQQRRQRTRALHVRRGPYPGPERARLRVPEGNLRPGLREWSGEEMTNTAP